MQNAIVFFKNYILEGDHEENDDKKMKKKLRIENKTRKIPLLFEELTKE